MTAGAGNTKIYAAAFIDSDGMILFSISQTLEIAKFFYCRP
jgi:hypothetical protein